jgi:hypothetical protein
MGAQPAAADRAAPRAVERVLSHLGRPDDGAHAPTAARLGAAMLLALPLYGLAMGLHEPTGARWLYALYSAIKLPLMVLATGALCLPGYVVLSTLLGLRADLRRALGAILASQTAVALALASLAPVTLFFYASGVSHRGALLWSGAAFAGATLAGQLVLLRHTRPLRARTRRHGVMLAYWLVAFVFVGIQMGWTLRPFVGSPGVAPTFLRDEPLSNAYVVVLRLVTGG